MIEVSLGQIIKTPMQCHASIVDKDVYRTDLPFNLCHHCLSLGAVADVGPHRYSLCTKFADRLDDLIRLVVALPVVNANVGTGLGELERNGPTDTARRSCDEGAAIAYVYRPSHGTVLFLLPAF